MPADRVIIDDRRNDEERKTHTVGVVGTDPGMSYWGLAEDRVSYACWACRPEDHHELLKRIEGRGDMQRVRTVDLRTYRPGRRGYRVHLSIYVHRPPEEPPTF